MKRPANSHSKVNESFGRRPLSATPRALLWSAGIATRWTRVDAKWARNYRLLLRLRERLLGEGVELLEQAAQPIEPRGMDLAISSKDEFDHDFVLGRLSTIRDALFEVDEAIERILNGSYGRCEETGRMISEARLKAVPWTRFARDVEESGNGIVSGLHFGRVGLVRGPLSGDTEMFGGSGEEEIGGSVANDEALHYVDASDVRSNRSSPRPATDPTSRILKTQMTHVRPLV